MADPVGIPVAASRGDWLADKSVHPSSPAGICLAAFEKLSCGESAWLGEAGTESRSTSTRSSPEASIFVRTGGSTGNPRFAHHTWATMAAAVEGLREVLGKEPICSWCCLPVWHVGGWMQVVRAVETGGNVVFGDYLDLAEPKADVNLSGRMVSLVPTQLHRLLSSNLAVARLRESRLILLGGGPLHEDLAGRARKGELPVAPTYGLTETAGVVTLLPPERFLSGDDGVGPALPHAELRLVEETKTLSIRGPSLCLG
ncbi:MAG: AMP-binding protein [Opitutales bacterium]